MIVVSVLIVSGFLALSGAPILEATDSLPDVASPPLGETQWVAEHMRLNGLPLSLKTFASSIGIDELFNYYESWGRTQGMKDAYRSRRDEWQVLAMKSTRHFVSIQARLTPRGAEGTIAVSPVPDAVRPHTATRFPHPRSATVVGVQQYQDGDLASEQISMISLRSVGVEARAFSEVLMRDGWHLMRNEPASGLRRGHVIEAQRGAEYAVMTLQSDRARAPATAIVIVWRKS